DAPLVAALADTLALGAPAAVIELDGAGRWQPLSKVPLARVGCADAPALRVPAPGAAPCRVLLAYFAVPARVDCVAGDV
ncbi:type VI secretion system baseplate subunit TssF, partial [Burkholderia pseudomallei]